MIINIIFILEQYAKIINVFESVFEYYGIYEMQHMFFHTSGYMSKRDWNLFKYLISGNNFKTKDDLEELKVIYNNGGI